MLSVSFFNTGITLKSILSTVLPGKNRAFIEPFFESKFSFKPDIESPTIAHVSCGQKDSEFCGVDGTSIT